MDVQRRLYEARQRYEIIQKELWFLPLVFVGVAVALLFVGTTVADRPRVAGVIVEGFRSFEETARKHGRRETLATLQSRRVEIEDSLRDPRYWTLAVSR